MNRRERRQQRLYPTDNLVVPPSDSLHTQENILQYTHRYHGKLLLREEYDIPPHIFTYLIDHHYITPIPSIRKTLLSTLCVRCHNQNSTYFANISCARCQKTHIYCRACINMGRVMECTMLYQWTGPIPSWPKHAKPFMWTGELTTVQQYAAKEMQRAVRRKKKLLTWAVAGAGKTEMLFPSIATALLLGKRICIASPRADVVRELMPRVQAAFKEVQVQGLYAGSRDKDGTSQLMIATTHQLLRFHATFDLIVIDEIDAFPYHQDTTLQLAAKRAAKADASFLYLTATPRKAQRRAMRWKQLHYVFVPIRFHHHLLPIPTFKYCSHLRKNLLANTVPKQFIQWFHQRKVPKRQILIFVPTIEMAHQIEPALATFFLQAGWIKEEEQITIVHAEDIDREAKVDQFRQLGYRALITTTILERGVTFPGIDVVIFDAGHPIFDDAALVQITGRAGRSAEDPEGEVVFFHQGKTNSMVRARAEMLHMNVRAKKHLQGEKK